jgi:hypothetical protein
MSDGARPILLCGENPGMTLYASGGEEVVAVASYWHCTYSQLGGGQALVVWLNPAQAGDLAHVSGVYTDNLPLARLLVEALTCHFPEFRAVPVATLPYILANCAHTSDGTHCYTATCTTDKHQLSVRWSELMGARQISWPAFPCGAAAYDLSTVICPCQQGEITVDGVALAGQLSLSAIDGQKASSGFLAFAETWIGPLEGAPAA